MSAAFGPFELVRLLGRGGMAEAFLARRPERPEQWVVLKRIRPDFAHSEAHLRRFVLEAQVASCLDHPSLVRFVEFGRVGQCHYIAMEAVRGHSLHRLLEAAFARGVRLEPEGALHLAGRLLDGLAVMHGLTDASGAPRPMLHRDVNPSNVIVRPDGCPVLIDFGIAKDVHGPAITLPGQVMGTARYMAPEHRKAEALDPRADVFSVAMVLFELLFNRHPWPPLPGMKELLRTTFEPPAATDEERARVSAPVRTVLLAALGDRPETRPADAARLRDALAATTGPSAEAGAAAVRRWVAALDLPEDEQLERPVVDYAASTPGATEVLWSADGALAGRARRPRGDAPAAAPRPSVLPVPPLPPRRVEVDFEAARRAALGPRRNVGAWIAAAVAVLAAVGVVAAVL